MAKITCDPLKGTACLRKRGPHLEEQLHQHPEVGAVRTMEDRLKEPDEQAQVVSAVRFQLVGIPPHAVYADVGRETMRDSCECSAGLFTQHKNSRETKDSVFQGIPFKRFTPGPTFRKRFRSLQCINKIFQRKYE